MDAVKFKYIDMPTLNEFGMRWYITPSGYLPSITTILGNTMPEEKIKSLESWRTSLGASVADKITKDAGHNGTAVHTLIERFLRKEELFRDGDNFNPIDISGFNAIKLKLKKIDEVWGQEIPLASDILGVAGRCDCVGVYREKPSIIDFKTSIRLKGDKHIEDYKLQICAYSLMHNEMYGTNITDGVILMSSAGGFPQEFLIDLTKYIEPLVIRVENFYQKLNKGN